MNLYYFKVQAFIFKTVHYFQISIQSLQFVSCQKRGKKRGSQFFKVRADICKCLMSTQGSSVIFHGGMQKNENFFSCVKGWKLRGFGQFKIKQGLQAID